MKYIKSISLLISILLLSACNNVSNNNMKYNEIVKIPEASGICLRESTNTFFVANDEWKIYEINPKWKILRKKSIGKYDFEWIVCNEEQKELYLLIEGTWNILPISIDTFKKWKEIILDVSDKDRKKYFNKKAWAEWLAMKGNNLYISTQNDKNNLLEFELSDDWKKVEFKNIYDIDSDDLSGMTYYNKLLYILSDKNDKIYKYSLKEKKIIDKISLKKWDWEWIVLDKKWTIYLADDAWRIVVLK